MLTGLQIRLARTALRWTVDKLADLSGVSWAKLQKTEKKDSQPNLDESLLLKIRELFESNGIEFIEENDNYHASIKIKK
tara:strand:- start:14024 stop:14260 length:237 start_codon:yes stop_codon:yes gene_type:complete